jgi:integrase
MLEELQRRNFAATTIRTYLHGVEHFSRYFRRPPDQLGPEDIRKYQAMLFTKLKYSPNTVILRLASLRFFYIHVLKRGWSIAETPYPKKVRHLPGVLSQQEVAQLIDAADSQLTALREVEALFVDEAGQLRGAPRHPDLILTLECSLLRVLDLTVPPSSRGLARREKNWLPLRHCVPSQTLAERTRQRRSSVLRAFVLDNSPP